MSCPKCEPFGGYWMETPAGMVRCTCSAGRKLSQPPTSHPPALSDADAYVFMAMLAAIPYFPSEKESAARGMIANEISRLCAGPDEAEWLVLRMFRLYPRWPGPLEMRHVYCAKYPPWDGQQPIGISEYYPDGIPSEREHEPPQLAAPAMRRLPSGQVEEAIEDPKIAATIRQYAARMPKMPAVSATGGCFTQTLEEITTAPQDRAELPGPTPQIITPEDIARAVEELHRQREGQPHGSHTGE